MACRLAYLVMHAELEGVVGSGPLRGKQFTYALVEERVPRTRSVDRGEALAELTRRYFASHGPALARDFAWWSGLTVANVTGKATRDAEALQAHIVVLNGGVIGGWRRTTGRKEIVLTTDLLVRLSKAERAALAEAAERYAGFAATPTSVRQAISGTRR